MAKKNLKDAGIIFLLAILLLSCEQRTAKQFLDTIDQQERIANDILLGEKGSESRKLEHIINNNFDSALQITAKQQMEFDSIIRHIQDLPTANLKDAQALQTASVQYYQVLKNLYGYAEQEIEQQKILWNASGNEQSKAQDKLMELTQHKQTLYQSVYRADSVFSAAKGQFARQHKLSR
ncbi:hypothetical protein [Sphingobacterium griseoflavum]|uniref:Viral A-type inclusion protein n=1 Tax=Sphingobacterium griseoflavum TaxID=1474952 RepID=A0ABQ3HT16_9SPHI|nr:hypothetical protein [Sphingobacterium griseoflavum]GHE23360.1 hypothetical protein GCM10017764_03280 [Sphingobacterium griseoflavum]